MSWLFLRCLRPGGVTRVQVAVNKRNEKGSGSKGQGRERGAWRSQGIQRCHGAPLRRDGPRELVAPKPSAPRAGDTRVQVALNKRDEKWSGSRG